MIGQVVSVAFQVQFMVLAVNRYGHSNKMCCQLQPKNNALFD